MKITDLTNYPTPDNSDVLPIVDLANNTTKKVTRTNLFANPPIADGAILPKMLVTGTGTIWSWGSWTSSPTNVTLGSGTVVAKYIQNGKTVHFYWKLALNSTTITGLVGFTLPVAASSNYSDGDNIQSVVQIYDASPSGFYYGVGLLANTRARLDLYVYNASGTYVTNSASSATVPITFASSDVIVVTGSYECA